MTPNPHDVAIRAALARISALRDMGEDENRGKIVQQYQIIQRHRAAMRAEAETEEDVT